MNHARSEQKEGKEEEKEGYEEEQEEWVRRREGVARKDGVSFEWEGGRSNYQQGGYGREDSWVIVWEFPVGVISNCNGRPDLAVTHSEVQESIYLQI